MDLRVIAATNEPLLPLVQSGKFRRDLYHRLNEFSIKVPALRERPEDILYLANRFIDMTNLELDKRVTGLSPEALARLMCYPWPGNVRELRNVIRSAVLFAEITIEVQHLAILDEPARRRLPGAPLGLPAGHAAQGDRATRRRAGRTRDPQPRPEGNPGEQGAGRAAPAH